MAKTRNIEKILKELLKKELAITSARALINDIINKEVKKQNNFKEMIPLVLSAKHAADYCIEDDGLTPNEVSDEDYINLIEEKVKLIAR